MFNDLTMSNDIQKEKDVIGGSRVLESGLYNLTVKVAYGGQSSGGAKFLQVVAQTDDGQEYRETLYVTNKKGENYYLDKSNNKVYLPGFNTAEGLCALAAGKHLNQATFEQKVIPVYDYDQKKEIPTNVPVCIDLIGKRITAGIIKQTVNKTVKDGQGNYQPTNEKRDENFIDKLFHIDSGMTVAELTAKATESAFKQQWADKFTGVTRDKFKAVSGTPSASAGASTGNSAAPKASTLFDD